jgi:hypothetical protein
VAVTAGALTEYVIPGIVNGMKYVWRVGYKDSAGKIAWSPEYRFTVGTPAIDSDVSVAAGSTRPDFKMFSFPVWTMLSDAEEALGIVYDPTKFKIGTYDPVTGTYIECDADMVIEPGRAYWMLAREGLDVELNGIPVTTGEDVEVKLGYNAGNQDGWNMISSPNNRSFYWDDIEVVEYDAAGNIVSGPTPVSALDDSNPWIDLRLWEWVGNSESYNPGAMIVKDHHGFWVKAKMANVSLRFSHSAPLSSSLSREKTLLAAAQRWLARVAVGLVSPTAAIADSGGPPMPMSLSGSAGSSGFSSGGGGSGCFIATAAYGSKFEPHVTLLREFRDKVLLKYTPGQYFVRFYYRYSPPLADVIVENDALRFMVRVMLPPLVAMSWFILNFGHAAIFYFTMATFFIFLIAVMSRQRRQKRPF